MGRFVAVCTAGLLGGAVALLAPACQSVEVAPTPGDADAAKRQAAGDAVVIYVASNGWHSAIVVPRAALPRGAIPEAADFPNAAYLSFGWGDAEYFPAPETTLGMTLRAALTPTPAVVHVAGLPSHPREVFPSDEVVALRATAGQVETLIAYLDATFDREGAARAQATAPGLHRFSRFYPAEGEFHLLNTCNTWTARGLAASGWPIRAAGVVTAEELMAQVRAVGQRHGNLLPRGAAVLDWT